MESIKDNLILTTQMLHAAWTEGVERFLVCSSSTGYPEVSHPACEEEMWTGNTHPSYFGYGWMRRYIERISEFVESKSNMGIALVRPSAPYGRWDNFGQNTSHVIPALIRRAVARENPYVVWGSGEEVRDFVHITDLARGCLLMLEKYAVCDPVNIGYGRSYTIANIVDIILRATNHKGAEVFFDVSKPTAIPYRAIDISKARRTLGFEPMVDMERGLIDTVEWYRRKLI
jgi:GDP-L-fucose synthase